MLPSIFLFSPFSGVFCMIFRSLHLAAFWAVFFLGIFVARIVVSIFGSISPQIFRESFRILSFPKYVFLEVDLVFPSIRDGYG